MNHIYCVCGQCFKYGQGEKLNYPNTPPEENTWRRCSIGNVVKNKSMACEAFEDDPLAV